MRISDWSSDVCSSDLGHARAPLDIVLRQAGAPVREVRYRMLAGREVTEVEMADGSVRLHDAETAAAIPRVHAAMARAVAVRSYRGKSAPPSVRAVTRSGARRVGKEGASRCRSRRSPCHKKTQNKN